MLVLVPGLIAGIVEEGTSTMYLLRLLQPGDTNSSHRGGNLLLVGLISAALCRMVPEHYGPVKAEFTVDHQVGDARGASGPLSALGACPEASTRGG